MGVHTWSYEPEKCDGGFCPCDCDVCPKAHDGEHIPFKAVLEALNINTEQETKDD